MTRSRLLLATAILTLRYGDHRRKIPERLRTHILPFFAAAFGR